MTNEKWISHSFPIPASAGIGAKPQHFHELLEGGEGVTWLEVHAENYMGAGGSPHYYLSKLREEYPLSVHGVGLSIGGAGPLNTAHLMRLKSVVDKYDPALVSEHLAWTGQEDAYLNDLLPIHYTDEALAVVCSHIDQVHDVLGRQILIENPSTYLTPKGSLIEELDFLLSVANRTGCGLLFDVNNVYVSCQNVGGDAKGYIDGVPGNLVGEIHLAGHANERRDGIEILIDDHGSAVCNEVWSLYERLIRRIGPKPTLIEWDTDVPELRVLRSEAQMAEMVMERCRGHFEQATQSVVHA